MFIFQLVGCDVVDVVDVVVVVGAAGRSRHNINASTCRLRRDVIVHVRFFFRFSTAASTRSRVCHCGVVVVALCH